MELIKIYRGKLVNARELWEFLEVNTKFSTWMQRVLEFGFEEGKEFFPFLGKTSSSGGRPQKEYYLTIGMAKEIAMFQRNEKGKEARKYFIKCEEKLIQLAQDKRFSAFMKLESTKEKFKDTLLGKGLTEENYIEIDTEGKRVFMNGEVVDDGLLQTVLLTARELATQMTHHNTLEKNMDKTEDIKSENRQNHSSVRDTLIDNNIVPERIPQQENVKKLKK